MPGGTRSFPSCLSRACPCSSRRRELVKLPAGSSTPIVKPLPSFPMRKDDSVVSADALPHDLLLLDIQQATCAFAVAAGGAAAPAGAPATDAPGTGSQQGRQLYCSVRLEAAAGPAARGAARPGSTSSRGSLQLSAEAPVRTRALPLGGGGVVAWRERLILALPMRKGVLAGVGCGSNLDIPSCLLFVLLVLTGACSCWHAHPDILRCTNQPAGAAEQALVFDVCDAAASGGRGASLGTGRLAVPVLSLQHRQEQAAEVSWEASGTAGAAVRLQLTYMLHNQWSFAKNGAAAPGPQGWSADVSTAGGLERCSRACPGVRHAGSLVAAGCEPPLIPSLSIATGQRALSLNSQPGSWAVIPAFGQQKAAATSAPATSASSAGERRLRAGWAMPFFSSHPVAAVSPQSLQCALGLTEFLPAPPTLPAAGAASVTPIHVGKEGLVVESSVAHVSRRGVEG